MNRRKAREHAFLALYQHSYGETLNEIIVLGREEAPDYAVDEFGEALLSLYAANEAEINQIIEGKLKGWETKRVARVNLAVLRLAVAEMLFGQPDMHSVVINEAVEIAKKYGDEDDYQFINGVLGNVSRERGQNDVATAELQE